MANAALYSDLLSLIRTKYEAEELLEELGGLLRSLYEDHGGKFDYVLEAAVRSEVSEIIKRELKESNLDREEYIQGLIEMIKGIEVLKMTIAYHPSQNDIEKIYTYVRKYVKSDVLLELNTDLKLMGGTIFIFKGEYRDCSLKKTFDIKKENIRQNITQLLSTSIKNTNDKAQINQTV